MPNNELAGKLAEDLERYFPDVVRDYAPQLFSVCKRLVGDEAEDIVQQTLIHVYGHFRGRDPEWLRALNLGAYLLRSARNECYKFFNRQVLAGQAHSLSAIHETEAECEALFDDPWDRLAMRQDLVTAIQTLPRIYQEVLYLYYGKDMQIKAIAQSLNEREVTIRSRLSRARDLLRAYFDISLEEREGDRRHV